VNSARIGKWRATQPRARGGVFYRLTCCLARRSRQRDDREGFAAAEVAPPRIILCTNRLVVWFVPLSKIDIVGFGVAWWFVAHD